MGASIPFLTRADLYIGKIGPRPRFVTAWGQKTLTYFAFSARRGKKAEDASEDD
jgi:hypothetical protein